jgi:phage antirepressor YoqD-like protein
MNTGIQVSKMTSLQIAEITGKRHSDVLEAIRNMEPAWVKVTQRKFPLSEYTDTTGRKLPMYELSKTECLYVATKFNDEARAKLVLRWEQLETKKQLDFSDPDTVLMLAQNWKEERQKRLEAESVIEKHAPKVLFADAVATSDRSILISERAKILKQNGVEIGQNRLFIWLREHGYLCSKGEYYNQPTQKAMESGLFEIKKTSITKPDGSVLVTSTTKVTGKGQIYFTNKFLKNVK